MKKILAMILAMLLVLSMSVAFAEDYEELINQPANFNKLYTISSGKSPAETFTFSFEYKGFKITGDDEEWSDEVEGPAIGNVTTSFAALTTTTTNVVEVALSAADFPQAGIYMYEVSEVAPTTKTAGVTYNEDKLYLVVTILLDENSNKQYVAAIHYETETGDKTGELENKYEAGTLDVIKTVTGNLGDKTEYFDVTVTFTAASGEVINSEITYTGGKYDENVTVENNTATIQVKDGDTVTFSNIPEGVTWKVEEADYTSEGYDAAEYSKDTDTMTAGGKAECEITNNKETEVDTGITLETLPYVLVLAVVLAGAALLIIRRRRSNED